MRYIPFAIALGFTTLVACGDKDDDDSAAEEVVEEATEEEEAEDTGTEE